MFWHPETQKYYSPNQVQNRFGILGMTEADCEERGFYIPVEEPKPSLTPLQKANRKPLPELVNGVWTKTWEVITSTQAEVDAQKEATLQHELKIAVGVSDVDKAIAFVLADIWRAQNPGLTVQEARQAVRSRLEFHLRDIKGI